MELLILLLIAYLIGSIPFGVILGKLAGLGDIRKVGSGNIGATNMLRAGGKKLAIATLLLDMAKGAAAVIPLLVFVEYAHQLSGFIVLMLACFVIPLVSLMVVLGHMFPVWLKFRGGKGVATMIGMYASFFLYTADNEMLIMSFIAPTIWVVVFLFARISSVAGIASAWSTPLYLYHFTGFNGLEFIYHYVWVSGLVIALLITFKHRDNIRRLLKGEEPKVSFSKR